MKKVITCSIVLHVLALSMLYAQTPSVTTKEPVVVTPYIYKVTPSSEYTYDAKVTFVGIVNPNGLESTVYFEYGPTTSYGNTIAASPSIVAGTDDIMVRATTVIHNCENDYQCRLCVVSGGVTYYGSNSTFAPEVDPTIKLLFYANCSDDASTTSFTVQNNNYFPVSVTCTDGTSTSTLNINQVSQQDFICNKNSMVSFYYNYTNPDGSTVYPFFFRKMVTNDRSCLVLPNPGTQITILSEGYKSNKDSAYYNIQNANDVDVEMTIIQGAAQSTVIVGKNSNRTILLLYYAVDFYYNNINIASFPAPLVKTKYSNQYVPSEHTYIFDDFSAHLCYAFPNKVYLDASDNTMTQHVVSNNSAYQIIPYQSWINGGSYETIYANDVPLSLSIGNNTTGQSRTGYITVLSGAPIDTVIVAQSSFTVPKNNLKLRLRADRGVTVSSSLVSEWDDISSNGNNATQSTGANQPAFIAGAMNNMPAMRFDGSSSYLSLPTSTSLGIQSHAYEMFIVARTSSSDIQFLMGGNTMEQFEYHLNGAVGARFIPTSSTYLDVGTVGAYTDGKPHIFAARASATGGAVRVDGVDGGTTTATITSSSANQLQLGTRADGTYRFNGDIAEVLIYDTVLTSAQRDSVEKYLADRYGITSGALPVELASFTAIASNNSTTLSWKTATETNNYGFEIERRTVESVSRGVVEWTKVGFVAGNGTSSSTHTYSYTDANVSSGTYAYRLKQIDNDGSYKYSSEAEVTINLPTSYAVGQNYPNPFNPTTTIKYDIPVGTYGNTSIKVYDIIGREIATLVNETKEAGSYQVIFNASKLASGVYFYKLQSGSYTSVKKLVLMK
jgi:hypothetical protein